MKKKLLFAGLLLLGLYSAVQAQSVGNDSRGKDIFNFYKSNAIAIPATTANTSFKLNLSVPIGKPTQYYIAPTSGYKLTSYPDPCTGKNRLSSSDSTLLTYQQSHGLNMAFEVSNVKTDITHASTFHPGYSLSVGYSENVDLFNNWSQINKLGYFQPHPWAITVYGKFDNVMLYDSLAKTEQRHKPFSGGVTGEISIMPYNFWFLSFSANTEWGNNLSDLTAYQSNTPKYIDSKAIALGEIAGKIGSLSDKGLFRLRISSPLILPAFKIFKDIQPCIIPYYNFYGEYNGKSNHMWGFFANILGQRVKKRDATIVTGAGFGIDWTHNAVWSHSIFVSGSLDLYKVIQPITSIGKFLN